MTIMIRSITAASAIAAFAIFAHICRAEDFTVPHDTLACMDASQYSTLLHQVGSVKALNQSAKALAAKFPLCTALRAGEIVSVMMGEPSKEAVMVNRQPANNDPRLPSYLRNSPLTYWANF